MPALCLRRGRSPVTEYSHEFSVNETEQLKSVVTWVFVPVRIFYITGDSEPVGSGKSSNISLYLVNLVSD
jgi:hypothetical protein